MPITDPNEQAGAASAPAAAPIPQYAPSGAPAAATAPVQGQPLRFGMSNGGSRLINIAPMEKTLGSEGLHKLMTKAEAKLKMDLSDRYTFRLIPVESGSNGLYYSTLLVALQAKERVGGLVAFHALILEASADAPTPTFIQMAGGKNIEVTRPASDAYDEQFARIVTDVVRNAFAGVEVRLASATVVPRDFDTENEQRVHRVIANAAFACHQELAIREPGFEDLQLSVAAQDSTLRVVHRFDSSRSEDIVGNAVRADVGVSFVSQQNTQNRGPGQQSLNSGDRQVEFSSIRGFVDLVWDPVQQAQPGWGQMAQQAMNPDFFKRYAARFVITSLDFRKYYTIPSTLAAIAAAITLRDNNNWYTAFWQRGLSNAADKKEIDLHDIGAIGYEVNILPGQLPDGKPYESKSSTWGPVDLGRLLSTVVRPGLMFSIDIADAGPETWHEDVFTDAANNPGAGNMAHEAIIRAANYLTGNAFSKYFGPNDPIFIDHGQRVHLGYYLDKDGKKRDLRDYDYLAALNVMGGKDMSVVAAWSDTFLNTNVPVAERLADRKKLLTNMNPTATITGFGTRETFSAKFLDSLQQACADAGLRMQLSTPMASGDFTSQRGVAGAAGALLGAGTSAFVQPAGMANVAAGGGGYTRWGGIR